MASGITIVSTTAVASGSQVVGAEGEGSTYPMALGLDLSLIEAAAFELNVTAAATVVGDTLNVYVQHSIDAGSTYDDFVSFTQVLGNGGAKEFIAQWVRDGIAPTAPLHAKADGSLAAGVNQGPVGDNWRVKWVVVSSSAPSFTFALTVRPIHRKR